MNGLLRRKNALMGYSTSNEAPDSGSIVWRTARMPLRGSTKMASAIITYQPSPALKVSVKEKNPLSQRLSGRWLTARNSYSIQGVVWLHAFKHGLTQVFSLL